MQLPSQLAFPCWPEPDCTLDFFWHSAQRSCCGTCSAEPSGDSGFAPWAPGGGRNPRFDKPLLFPSLLDGLEPSSDEGLPVFRPPLSMSVLFGELHPAGVFLSGTLIGALEAGAGAMQRDAGIPSVAVYIVEAVIIIVALLATTLKGGWVNARVIRRIRPSVRKPTT